MENKKDVFDFGFTFADEAEVIVDNDRYRDLQKQVSDLRNRIDLLKSMFVPFLENLAKEPDKAMIKWPNRSEVVTKQLDKLRQITDI
jgi:hypothetical protein